ncbi:MAG: anion permease [Planctomycetaceae bacterium]
MALIFVVIVVALVFEFINGFHDTANSIATVVATKVLKPQQAVMLAAVTNLIGAMCGTAVATTISSGLIDPQVASQKVLLCALLAAILWNLITWRAGLPSSSSHALVGGLVGAAVAAAGNWNVVIWKQADGLAWYQGKGLIPKVVVPMFASPLFGFVLGFLVMVLIYSLLRRWKPRTINFVFGKLQIASAAAMGLMHGTNDAQKTMGIIALAWASGASDGHFADLPKWLSFLQMDPPEPGQNLSIALWIKVCCALVMAAGTASGGWRIIKTLGHKMVRLQPVNGFAAETSSSAVIAVASHFGIPVSTTQNISASIMGVGAAKRFNALKWTIVERMVWAWILTIPVSGTIAYMLMRLLVATGHAS